MFRFPGAWQVALKPLRPPPDNFPEKMMRCHSSRARGLRLTSVFGRKEDAGLKKQDTLENTQETLTIIHMRAKTAMEAVWPKMPECAHYSQAHVHAKSREPGNCDAAANAK